MHVIIQGLLVYVNYGRLEDFNYIKYNLSVDISGRICIARYGRIFRGDKVKLIHVIELLCNLGSFS